MLCERHRVSLVFQELRDCPVGYVSLLFLDPERDLVTK